MADKKRAYSHGLMDSLKRRRDTWHCGGKNSAGAKIDRHSTKCRDKQAAFDYLKNIDKLTQAEWDAKWNGRKEPKAPEPTETPKGLTIQAAFEDFLASVKEDDPDKGSGTKKAYRRVLPVEFVSPLTRKGLVLYRDVRSRDCLELQQGWETRIQRNGKKLSPRTIETYRRYCITMAHWLCRYREDDAPRNPWAPVKSPEKRDLTQEEIDAGKKPEESIATWPLDLKGNDNWRKIQTNVIPFLAGRPGTGGLTNRPENFLALLEVFYETGLRRGDAIKFLPSRLKRSALGYTYTTQQGKSRGKQDVTVFVPQELAEKVIALPGLPWRGRPSYPHAGFYPFWDGSCSTTKAYMDSRVNEPLRELGKQLFGPDSHNLRPHRFRDSFAANMLNGGASIEQVAKMLGHRNPQMVRNHYNPPTLTAQEALEAQTYAARRIVTLKETQQDNATVN